MSSSKRMCPVFLLGAVTAIFLSSGPTPIWKVNAFTVVTGGVVRSGTRYGWKLWEAAATSGDKIAPDQMKLRDIQGELKDMGVSFTDCFDRDSLTKRLMEARSRPQSPEPTPEQQTSPKQSSSSEPPKTNPNTSSNFDREAVVAELNGLRVSELRTQLGQRNIRWAGMLEKRDLVDALANAMEAAQNFSPSGKLTPGEVADIDDQTLEQELSAVGTTTPLLLDVYATWCGPCQMMAPQLAAAAKELGDTVRVAKIDSDKYTQWASRLKVGGLPTVIVFGPDGVEVDRIEGALMKDGLINLVQRHL